MAVVFLFGVPESGKTFKAVALAAEESGATGRPVLCVDPIGDAPVVGAVECGRDWRLALRTVYQAKRHARVIPESEAVSECLAAAVLAGGNVVAVWDELGFFSSGRSIGPRLEELIRTARHRAVSFYGASQYVGDLPSGLLNCPSQVYIFRNSSWRAVDRIEKEYDADPEAVRWLEPRAFLTWSRWSKKTLDAAPPTPA